MWPGERVGRGHRSKHLLSLSLNLSPFYLAKVSLLALFFFKNVNLKKIMMMLTSQCSDPGLCDKSSKSTRISAREKASTEGGKNQFCLRKPAQRKPLSSAIRGKLSPETPFQFSWVYTDPGSMVTHGSRGSC